jgi:mRNA degradation ribonuclease J1/J2
VPAGRLFLERVANEAIDPERIKEREQLARHGLVIAVVLLDAHGHPRRAPLVHGKGLTDNELRALPRIAQLCLERLNEVSPQLLRDDLFVQEEATAAIRRAYKESGMRRPGVLVLVVRH